MDSKCQSPVLTKTVLSDVRQASANDKAQLGEGEDEEGDRVGVEWLWEGRGVREYAPILMKPGLSDVWLTTANDQLGERR